VLSRRQTSKKVSHPQRKKTISDIFSVGFVAVVIVVVVVVAAAVVARRVKLIRLGTRLAGWMGTSGLDAYVKRLRKEKTPSTNLLNGDDGQSFFPGFHQSVRFDKLPGIKM